MNLEALADMLAANGLGTPGKDLFLHNMPDVDEGVMFRLPLTGIPIDQELPGRYRHSMQVVLRGIDVGAMVDRADRIMALLTMAEKQIGGMSVTYIRPTALPIVYPRSEQSHAAEASINFDCCYVLG